MVIVKYLEIYFEFQRQGVNIHSEDNVPYIVSSMIGVLNLHFILFE